MTAAAIARVTLLFSLLVLAPSSLMARNPPALLPLPQSAVFGGGEFRLTPAAGVYADGRLAAARDAVQLLLAPATGYPFPGVEKDVPGGIRFLFDPGRPAEGYRLKVTPAGVEIHASAPAGAFYALQTLRQLLPPAIYARQPLAADWTIPTVAIEDAPRFAWRGMHLDVGRHFMPVAFIRKFIDLLALHKMNTFHWHLTEDQGWRIEIQRYPQLTAVGAWRAQTMTGSIMDLLRERQAYDGTPHGGFYTQEEVREIVAYAAARHVTVVPEIEFPGHAQAAIAAYPELGNSGARVKVKEEWGISRHTLKPSPETLAFYRNVLTEVMALFPSRYIHIGGDEVSKDEWAASPYAQQRMAQLDLADENALQSWLIRQMDDFLDANGRSMVGWDEIMQGGLSPNATVMSWRGMGRGLRAAQAGHDVVMAPTAWTYFDYYQGDRAREPQAIGSYLPLRKVYAFDPAPAELPAAVRERILGAQGQLWTEFMRTPEHVEYMAYPRAAALAEVLWSAQQQRDYAGFQQRLPSHLRRLDHYGVNYRPPGNDALGLRARLEYWLWTAATGLYFWWQD